MTEQSYAYDEAGRLTEMHTTDGAWLYTYDVMGNRLTSEFLPGADGVDAS